MSIPCDDSVVFEGLEAGSPGLLLLMVYDSGLSYGVGQ